MKKKGKVFIFAGLLLIAAALLLAVCNVYEQRRAAQSAAEIAEKLESVMPEKTNASQWGTVQPNGKAEIPDYILNPDMEMPVESIDGVNYIGILEIPELGLNLPITAGWNYSSLKNAPGRYSGSAYKEGFIIAGHNYDSHFGRLKALHEESVIIFTDMDGNEFDYEVTELETLSPYDVEKMKGGDWDLTLFTCTIGGQSRVTVRCESVL